MRRYHLVLLLLLACGRSESTSRPPVGSASGSAAIAPVEDRARALIEQLVAGKHAAIVATFDAKMAAALSKDALEKTWNALIAQVGAFEACEDASTERAGVHRVVSLTCKFAHAKLQAKVVYDESDKVAGLTFVPATEPYSDPPYVDRTKFDETDVVVGRGEWELPGTLAMPRGDGPFPAVVLVHGSGPNDRDESVGANKPFKDLAGGLASRGIAVLRYDKRSKVHGEKLAKLDDATLMHETVDDAVLAVELLRARKEIGPIVVAGHSLGGFAAPRIGERSKDIAGIAILAGSTRPVPDMMIEQIEYIASVQPPPDPAQLAAAVEQVKAARTRILELQNGAKPNPSERVLGAGAAYWIDFGKYNAVATATRYGKPILVAAGGRDYQVTKTDFTAWETALKKRSNVTFKWYAELNHLLGAGTGKSSPQEYDVRAAVDPRVVEDLAAWIESLK